MKKGSQNEKLEKTMSEIMLGYLLKSLAYGLSLEISVGALAGVTGYFQTLEVVPALEIFLAGSITYFVFSGGLRLIANKMSEY